MRAASLRRLRVVDSPLVAMKLAAVRDAIARIQAVLPSTLVEFQTDRTAREVVALNLFVAIQECLGLASHILADAGWGMPRTYGESFSVLAEHDVLSPALALRMRAAAGLRNLLAHQYGVVDFDRVFELARDRLDDLNAYCAAVAGWIERQT